MLRAAINVVRPAHIAMVLAGIDATVVTSVDDPVGVTHAFVEPSQIARVSEVQVKLESRQVPTLKPEYLRDYILFGDGINRNDYIVRPGAPGSSKRRPKR